MSTGHSSRQARADKRPNVAIDPEIDKLSVRFSADLRELVARQKKRMEPGFDKRVRLAFENGVADECARLVWSQINHERLQKMTTRVVRQRTQLVHGVSQEQLAAAIGKSQGTISRWFNYGTPQWSHIVVTLTELGLELANLTLPAVEHRTQAGIARCLFHINAMELKVSNVREPSPSEIRQLALLYSTWPQHRRALSGLEATWGKAWLLTWSAITVTWQL